MRISLQGIQRGLRDPLKTFRAFEITIAAICMTIPLLLKLADWQYAGFRDSISAYVDMPSRQIFGMLLCIPSMLFIFNGAVYFRNESRFGLKKGGKWYNIALGFSLLGVILFHYVNQKYFHFAFAILFFVGNALVIAIYHKKKHRWISLFLALLTVTFLVLGFTKQISLLAGEWLSLAVIGIHFILETTGILPPSITRPRDVDHTAPEE